MKVKVFKRKGLSGAEVDFASVSNAQSVTQKDIAREIEETVGIPMIRSMSVLEAFATIVRKNIAEGNIVEIEGIGRVRVSVTVKDGTPVLNKLILLPSKTLKAELDKVSVEIED